LFAADGTVEATARKTHNEEELPEGQWMVNYPDGEEQLTNESEMPQSWKDQIKKAIAFGNQI
jgi:hypothetical protein